MITRRFLPFVVLMAAAIAVVAATEASATTLNLDTGKAVSIAPGTTGSITFSVTNVDSVSEPDFIDWQLGVQIIPTGGNVGTISFGTLGPAASDQVPGGSLSITQPTDASLTNPINGTRDYKRLYIETTDAPSTLLPGNSYNLGTLSLSASADAAGSWDVYAVQENSTKRSYWETQTVFQQSFGNLLTGGGDVALRIGTITVVPEPSTAGMLVVALGAAGLVVRNRRSRKAIEPVKGDVLAESGSRCIGA